MYDPHNSGNVFRGLESGGIRCFRQSVLVDFCRALFSVRARFRFHFKDNVFCVFQAELKRVGILDDRFVLHFPVEYLIYTDTEKYGPYHFGEMITKWGLPTMKREVEEIWQE